MRLPSLPLANAVHSRSEEICRAVLAEAGVGVDGARAQDMKVHDRAFYTRLLRDGMLGFGEGYMDAQWDCEELDTLVEKMVAAELDQRVKATWSYALHAVTAKVLNLQSATRAFQVGEEHYDLGNDLYEAMLDGRMAYTCGYWKDAADLDAAQEAKLDLVCRKIGLREGMRVLELGCGWGSFAGFAAEKYGAEVIGYTVSKEQVDYGNRRYRHLPVELRYSDYREAEGTFDAVVSIGILEHIGPKNLRDYFETARRCVKDDGIAFVHTIGGNKSGNHLNTWFHKYIFPNAVLPSLAQIARASEALFCIEDVHNFGEHYATTLMAWYERFESAWPQLRARYDDRFYRMWRFYLLSCAGSFRARYQQLYQVVLTPLGIPQPAHVRQS